MAEKSPQSNLKEGQGEWINVAKKLGRWDKADTLRSHLTAMEEEAEQTKTDKTQATLMRQIRARIKELEEERLESRSDKQEKKRKSRAKPDSPQGDAEQHEQKPKTQTKREIKKTVRPFLKEKPPARIPRKISQSKRNEFSPEQEIDLGNLPDTALVLPPQAEEIFDMGEPEMPDGEQAEKPKIPKAIEEANAKIDEIRSRHRQIMSKIAGIEGIPDGFTAEPSVVANERVEVKNGDTIWSIIEEQLNAQGKLMGLSTTERIAAIDALKDKVMADPTQYDIASGDANTLIPGGRLNLDPLFAEVAADDTNKEPSVNADWSQAKLEAKIKEERGDDFLWQYGKFREIKMGEIVAMRKPGIFKRFLGFALRENVLKNPSSKTRQALDEVKDIYNKLSPIEKYAMQRVTVEEFLRKHLK